VSTGGKVDFLGAVLAAAALAGPVFALTEQPVRGWSGTVLGTLAFGAVAAIAFVAREARTRAPMLPLSLFRERNFTVGNIATFTTYLGLGAVIFLMPLFLQQIAGYSPVQAGLALLPVTALMILLSGRFGALSDRIGPRTPMAVGPIVAAGGVLLLLRIDRRADYVSQVLPGLIVFGLGLAMLVAPLTATVLGAVEQSHAGIASAVNNTLTRVAILVAVAALGAVLSAAFASSVDKEVRAIPLGAASRVAVTRAKRQPLGGASLAGVPPAERAHLGATIDNASVHAFHVANVIAALLTASGGLISLAGIRNPRRAVAAQRCRGGALCGASEDIAHTRPAELFDRGFAQPPRGAT
jgi:predicted MFS family arabinose efflux permease